MYRKLCLTGFIFQLLVATTQGHPLDISNALPERAYVETWYKATLEDVATWLQSSADVNARVASVGCAQRTKMVSFEVKSRLSLGCRDA